MKVPPGSHRLKCCPASSARSLASSLASSVFLLVACIAGSASDPAPLGKLTNANLDSADRAGYRYSSGLRTDKAIAISGNTAVIGAHDEDSNATGINGDPTNNDAEASGAAYVYIRSGDTNWILQAYLKASNTEAYDRFGACVAIDGDIIVVGAPFEDSNAVGLNGEQSNNEGMSSGAAYIFVREGTNWIQNAYLKLDPYSGARGFGQSVAIYGNTVAIGSDGAIDVFVRDGHTWRFEQRVAPDLSQSEAAADSFGEALAISGNRLLVGAPREDSNATGVNGNESNGSATWSGAAYVFSRTNGVWTKDAYLKPSNTEASLYFGQSVSISGDTVIVGAYGEDSGATGVNGDDMDQSASSAGAAYVFHHDGTSWSQQAYLKASNTAVGDNFGVSVALAGDLAAVGADLADDPGVNSGAVYLFRRTGGNWSQSAQPSAFDGDRNWSFGGAVAIDEPIVIANSYFADASRGATYAFLMDASNFVSEVSLTSNGNEIVNGSTTISSTLNTDFGSSGFATNEFVITNSGTGTLTLRYPRFSGDAATDFSVVVPPLPTLAPGGSTSFRIRFAPTANGARAAIVSISNNDADESAYSFAIQGTGTGDPEIAILGNSMEIVDGDTTPDTADDTDFGATDFFTGVVTKTFSITNSGTTTLALDVPTVTASGPADFRISSAPSDRLDPGATTEFSVAFDPSTYLTNTAVVSLGNSDTDENPYEFTIRGVSEPEPELDLFGNRLEILTGDTTAESPDGTDFGTLTVGSGMVTNSFTLTNAGTATLNLTNFNIVGAAGFRFVTPVPLSIEPGETNTFGIIFAPTANGPRTATITIASNDRDEPAFTFAIAGIANPASPSDPIYFGQLTYESRDINDRAGDSVAISGNTAVVGVVNEDSSATGVNGDPTDDTATAAGAAHVYVRGEGTNWVLQAYLKASNTTFNDFFGAAVGIHGDIIVVGAPGEDSNATDVNGDETNNDSPASGAAYVFARQGTNWSQVAYLKPDSGSSGDDFGKHVDIYGETIVVGTDGANAAYVFVRSGNTWVRQTRLAPDLPGSGDGFGRGVAISGETVVVGAYLEDSNATGVNGDASNGSSGQSGAAYVFVRSGDTWAQQAYLKPSNTDAGDYFGEAVAISGDTIVVGADREDSAASGVNGNQTDNSLTYAGAAYVFTRSGTEWSQQAYLKASNPGISDGFGESVAVAGDIILVGAKLEGGTASSINGDQSNGSGSQGATYLFVRSGTTWTQKAYLKGYFGSGNEQFGESVAADGSLLLASAPGADTSRGITYPILLAASNTVPEIAILGNSSEIANGSTTISTTINTDFGAAATNTFTITNLGTGTLTIGYPRISGTEADDFRLLEAPAASLAPNTTTTFSIRFAATASGIRMARVSIANNDADESTYVFDIQGAVTGDPEIMILGNGIPIGNGDSTPEIPDATDFGAADFFTGIVTNTFTVTNTGTATLTLGIPTITGSADFQLHTIPAALIDPGESSIFRITFDPSTYLTNSATVSLVNGDGGENPYEFTVHGVSSPEQELDVLGNEVAILTGDTTAEVSDGTAFGTVTIGGSVITNFFTVTNSGTATLTFSVPTLTGAAGFLVVAPPTLSLEPGETTAFAITYAPTANGPRQATVSIASSDRDEALFTFAVAGIALPPSTIPVPDFQTYLRSEFRDNGDYFGRSVAVSGNTAVIGAPAEHSAAVGVNGDPADNSASDAGAAYVYVRSGGNWLLQAYLKASNTGANDDFGNSVAIDGDTIIIGAPEEDSDANGINGDGSNNGRTDSGAAYVFVRTGTNWTQQAFLKPGTNDAISVKFGDSVSISGETVVIGAPGDDNLVSNSGGTYVFVRNGGIWIQQQLLKASNVGSSDLFGESVSISGDTIIVGARQERSNASGINGNGSDNSKTGSGAAYVFFRNGVTWTEQAYLKSGSPDFNDQFGYSVAIDGNTAVVGERRESGLSTGIGGDHSQVGNSSSIGYFSGAAHVFHRTGDQWSQQAYLKASNAGSYDYFGVSVTVSGNYIAVGADEEDSDAIGVNGAQDNDEEFGTGATYLFHRRGSNWIQHAFLKPTHFSAGGGFGESIALSGSTLIVGAPQNGSTGGGTYTLDFSSPEIQIHGNGQNIASGTNAPVSGNLTDFGTVPLGPTGITNTFSITNLGDASLTLGTPAITGPGATDFTIITEPATNLSAGASTVLSVAFHPTVTGLRTAMVSIANNDLDENPFVFDIHGTGAAGGAPEIVVTGNAMNITTGAATPLVSDGTDFGSADLLFTTVTNTFFITNDGTVTLTLTAPVITGLAAGDFSITLSPATTVAPAGFTALSIAFDPDDLGPRSANVSIGNNDADENPFTFAIQGTGTGAATIAVLGGGLEITNNVTSPSSAHGTDFGPLDVLATGVSRTFVITNQGSIPLSLGTASITGPAAADFTISAPPGSPIAPGSFTTLTVVFDPSASGLREAGISLPNNSALDPFAFAIAGTGTGAPEIAVYGNGLLIASGASVAAVASGTEYGVLDIDAAPASHTFSITNHGSLHLTISAPTFSGPGAADFSAVPPGTTTVAPGQGITFGITFDPSALGLRSAIASIANNDADESPYTFAIRGGGRGEPEIAVGGKGVSIADGESVPSVTTGTDFGVHDLVGASFTNTFVITNTGTTNLLLGLPVLTGSAVGDFAFLSTPSTLVAPGLSTSFDVLFDPSLLGERPALITFTNSDADENPFAFAIRGAGVGSPEISVLGKGVNITNNDVLPTLDDGTHFGTINTDSATFTNTFVIRNDGTTNLTLSAPVISGTGAADFTLSDSPATDLAPGVSTSFSIVFDPSVDGNRAATISISNNDDNEASFEFAITGTGTTPPPATPEIAVLGKMLLIPDGANSPRAADGTDFGAVDTANGTATNIFVITNSGTAELTLSVPTVTGGAAAEFTLVSPPSPNVPVNGTTAFALVFDPAFDGPRPAVLTLANTDPNESPYSFAITGTGTSPVLEPEIAILGKGVLIADGDTTPSLSDSTDFGSADVSSGAITKLFTITNSGSADLTVGGPTISGPAAADFAIAAAPPITIPAAGAGTFTVRFAPSAVGNRNATIEFTNNDTDESPFNFAIRGQGTTPPPSSDLLSTYLKTTNTTAGDRLGQAIAMSGDTLIVGAPFKSVAGNSNQGAVYVYVRQSSNWFQQAQLIAPSGGSNDLFGNAVDISHDTIVIGAPGEDSAATGVNSDQQDATASGAGAAYVFVRDGDAWSVQSYLKPNNTDAGDRFGESVAIDGNSLIVGAYREDGSSTNINVSADSNSATNSGAAYVFGRTGTSWSEVAYLKAPNADQDDSFGFAVDVSGDLFAISATGERGLSGTDGDLSNNHGFAVGAVYLFERNQSAGNGWLFRGYLKADNAFPLDHFGWSLSLDGGTLAVGTPLEDGGSSGSEGDGSDNSKNSSGAVYIFEQNGNSWSQQVYLKASNPDQGDYFGNSVDLRGGRLIVGAPFEESNAVGLNGDQLNNTLSSSGAAYLFTRSGGTWSQTHYIKASNTEDGDFFASSVALSDNVIAIGAPTEDSNATGINGGQSNNDASSAGAVYVYFTPTTAIGLQAYLKASNPSVLARFSDAVAIGDEFAAVGAPDVNTVYLFRKQNNTWQPMGSLTPDAGGTKAFGHAVALSDSTLVIGAPFDRSAAAGINGDESNFSGSQVGSVYVYVFDGNNWVRQVYVKASNPDSSDRFGYAAAIDGDTLVIGAPQEDGDGVDVNGDESSNAAANAGAAYVFVRSGTSWTQQAYLKASVVESSGGDQFGSSVAIHGDTVVVGAPEEDSNSSVVNGDQSNNSLINSGAAYLFVRSGTNWLPHSYIKTPNPVVAGEVGRTTALHGDTLALGTQIANRVDVFTREGTQWSHSATLSSANAQTGDRFGFAIALHDTRLVVGAPNEGSRSRVRNRLPEDNTANDAGAVYEFVGTGTNWVQQNYIKAHNTDPADYFGTAVGISADHIIVGAPLEDGNGTGRNGNPASNGLSGSGAAYIYGMDDTLPSFPNEMLVIRATAPHSASHDLVLPSVSGATYQWYFTPFPNGNTTPINGATGSTYITGLAERNRTGYYSALVTTPAGSFLTTPTFLDIVKPQEILSIVRLSNGHIRLRFDDVNSPGRPLDLSRVEVQWRNDLPHGSDTNWNQVIGFSISATSETVTFDDPSAASSPIRFYRVLEH